MKLSTRLILTAVLSACIASSASMFVAYVAFYPNTTQPVFLACMFIGISMLTGTLTAYTFNLQVTNPIRKLSSAVASLSAGGLSKHVSTSSSDELDEITHSLHEMSQQLGSVYHDLQATTATAKEEQARLESSINGLRQGFILIDTRNQIILANRAALRTIGGQSTHHKYASLQDIAGLLPAEFDLVKAAERTMHNQRRAKFANLALGGRYYNIYLSPVTNEDTVIGCAMVLDDITEERILQRSRDEFFSIASHELRTPLTAIRGNTSMIMEFFAEALKDPNLKDMIDDIHNSSVRLIEIVNDFLDSTRLEQDKMQFNMKAFAVEPLIEKALYELAGVSREKHVALNFDHKTLGELPEVYADPERTTQIIYNLMGNALKFTTQGSVSISCHVDDKHLKVDVTDTGPGISPEGQQILFHKFQQSTTNILTRDNTRGTGLGLYISRLLAEHMGGAVQLEHSELGKGSTFSFTLPLASKEQIAATQAAATTTPSAPAADTPIATKTKVSGN